MNNKRENNLIIIEKGRLRCVSLDDKQVWEVGRPAGDNIPDIKLYSSTVSRKHGKFHNIDGVWFYVDLKGKNGTVYNGKHITSGRNGRVKPVMIKDGDIFIFGGGEEAVINSKTIWSLYTTRFGNKTWRTEDTKGMSVLVFSGGECKIKMEDPAKGTVVEQENGMAIYMGDITYLTGNINVTEEK